MNALEVADVIESFLDGSCGDWDWDDFMSARFTDADLEIVRRKCAAVPQEFPPTAQHTYCSEEGVRVLRGLAHALRQRNS